MESRTSAVRIAIALVAGFALSRVSVLRAQTASNDQDTWQFKVTPYLWAAGQSGTARVGNVLPARNVDASFSDLLSHLSIGAMGAVEARRDRWMILFDAFYVKLTQTSDPLLGGALGTAKLRATNQIYQLAGGYRVTTDDNRPVDVVAGVRYFDLSSSLQFFPSQLLPNGFSVSQGRGWTDGFVGARVADRLSPSWTIYGYADVGTGGSKFSWQALVGAAWQVSPWVALQFGFRVIGEDYDHAGLLYNVRTGGPYAGATFTFK